MSLIDFVQNSAWAIVPEKLDAIHDLLYRHAIGQKMEPKELQAMYGDRVEDSFDMELTEEGLAVISMNGVLARKMNMMMAFSGGTSMELTGRDFNLALNDNDVRAIVLRMVDVPGGTVAGTETLADGIYEARGRKPMVTFATGMMASAGFWIGSATDGIIVEETTDVGSIGVVQAHYDYSGADEKAGVKRTFIYAGKYKVAGNDAEPLNDEMHAYLKGGVDYMYKVFVDGVARNLGVEPADILADKADGKLFIGRQALDVGLVHEIGNMEAAMEMALEMAASQQTNREVFDMALGKTKVAVVEPDSANGQELTREILEASAPEMVSGFLAEGATAEREKIIGLAKIHFGDDSANGFAAIVNSGTSVETYKAIKDAMPKTEAPKEAAKPDKMDKMLAAIQDAGAENPGAGSHVAGPANFTEAWQAIKAEKGCSTEAAMKAAVRAYPDLHKAFISQPAGNA